MRSFVVWPLFLVLIALLIPQSLSFSSLSTFRAFALRRESSFRIFSSEYSDFGDLYDDDSDDEEDDDDEYDDLDDSDVASFRNKMSSLFEDSEESKSSSSSAVDDLIAFARKQDSAEGTPSTDWAEPINEVKPGTVLVANPAKFCPDFGNVKPQLLSKFGLTLPPPVDLGPDRRADLLPVLVVVDTSDKRTRAVLLNRRTGYLLGDLEQPNEAALLEKFCIQPLWFGGIDNVSNGGLDLLHLCPGVAGAKQITEDGLWWGGEPAQASEALEKTLDRVYTGFDFKFFVQNTIWSEAEIQREIKDGTWYCAKVSKEVLFKPRDRMGTRRAKPLWTEIMELLGGKYQEVRDKLYA